VVGNINVEVVHGRKVRCRRLKACRSADACGREHSCSVPCRYVQRQNACSSWIGPVEVARGGPW
jgi:hypothetical protein